MLHPIQHTRLECVHWLQVEQTAVQRKLLVAILQSCTVVGEGRQAGPGFSLSTDRGLCDSNATERLKLSMHICHIVSTPLGDKDKPAAWCTETQ